MTVRNQPCPAAHLLLQSRHVRCCRLPTQGIQAIRQPQHQALQLPLLTGQHFHLGLAGRRLLLQYSQARLQRCRQVCKGGGKRTVQPESSISVWFSRAPTV
jgi:hypothetical protein